MRFAASPTADRTKLAAKSSTSTPFNVYHLCVSAGISSNVESGAMRAAKSGAKVAAFLIEVGEGRQSRLRSRILCCTRFAMTGPRGGRGFAGLEEEGLCLGLMAASSAARAWASSVLVASFSKDVLGVLVRPLATAASLLVEEEGER